MGLHFTLGYHPEGNGQTKHTNQTLEQYLCVYCNYQQDNWSDLLPITEFTFNNAPSATTGISPFFANKGYHPALAMHPKYDITLAHAQEFAIDLQELHLTLKLEISLAQQCYQHSANLRLVRRYLLKHNSSKPPNLQRSYPRSILALMRS